MSRRRTKPEVQVLGPKPKTPKLRPKLCGPQIRPEDWLGKKCWLTIPTLSDGQIRTRAQVTGAMLVDHGRDSEGRMLVEWWIRYRLLDVQTDGHKQVMRSANPVAGLDGDPQWLVDDDQ